MELPHKDVKKWWKPSHYQKVYRHRNQTDCGSWNPLWKLRRLPGHFWCLFKALQRKIGAERETGEEKAQTTQPQQNLHHWTTADDKDVESNVKPSSQLSPTHDFWKCCCAQMMMLPLSGNVVALQNAVTTMTKLTINHPNPDAPCGCDIPRISNLQSQASMHNNNMKDHHNPRDLLPGPAPTRPTFSTSSHHDQIKQN